MKVSNALSHSFDLVTAIALLTSEESSMVVCAKLTETISFTSSDTAPSLLSKFNSNPPILWMYRRDYGR